MRTSEYAEAGIADYWILELEAPATRTWHRLQSDGVYRRIGEHRGAVGLELCGSPIRLDVETLTAPA